MGCCLWDKLGKFPTGLRSGYGDSRRGRSGQSSAKVRAVKNIYIGNLPFSATEAEIRQLFEGYGSVSRIHLVTDRDTGRPRGFGFVDMDNDGEADAAMKGLNGSDMGGRTLTVNEARPREPRRGPGGGGGDRW